MKEGFEDQKVRERMKAIRHKILVLSGKGGVGKSTIAVNLAVALTVGGRKVGLLDIDVHGPSVPKLLGVDGFPLSGTKEEIHPFALSENLRVMSIGFLLRREDDAVIWRGPMKYNLIKQFLRDVSWGELDYLIVDSPPGTGDEPLSVVQLLGDADGAVIVTTPQDVALLDVRKCINFCRQLSLPVIGVVENMSGFICPRCGERTDIFKSGGGEKMARDMNVPFLGKVPVDPGIVSASDEGRPYVANFPHTEAGRIFAAIAAPILSLYDREGGGTVSEGEEPMFSLKEGIDAAVTGTVQAASLSNSTIRIAVPVTEGKLSMHFGHSEQFALIDVDRSRKEILAHEFVDAPAHQPGLLPVWLKERGARLIIASGMGRRAQTLFEENGIEVLVGARSDDPDTVVQEYLDGILITGENICDH